MELRSSCVDHITGNKAKVQVTAPIVAGVDRPTWPALAALTSLMIKVPFRSAQVLQNSISLKGEV